MALVFGKAGYRAGHPAHEQEHEVTVSESVLCHDPEPSGAGWKPAPVTLAGTATPWLPGAMSQSPECVVLPQATTSYLVNKENRFHNHVNLKISDNTVRCK